MGSVIPGILLAGSLIVYALVYGKRKNLPAHEKQTPKQIGHAFKAVSYTHLRWGSPEKPTPAEE